jgi:hypothetical protein
MTEMRDSFRYECDTNCSQITVATIVLSPNHTKNDPQLQRRYGTCLLELYEPRVQCTIDINFLIPDIVE